jgi:hypothetical protein
MKLVTFTREMRPHCAGDTRLVPDDVAASLLREGAVEPDPPSFPSHAQDKDARAQAPHQTYQTKRHR